MFRKMKGIQRKFPPAFVVFQVLTAQNNQYTKEAHFGMAYSANFQYL